jgi:hypothetical protein
MTMRRLLLLIALPLAAGAVAACGGAGTSEAAGTASLAPAAARAVVEVDGDLDSTQWRAARDLVDRFPDGDELLGKLREIDAAAGDRIVVVLLGEQEYVALTQPDDASKLRSLVGEHKLVSREVAGWTAVAKDAGIIDRYEQALGRGTLESDERYEAARAGFPDEALVTAYARGDKELESAALALTAEDGGFRIAGKLRNGPGRPQPVAAGLVEEVPADAYVALAFGGGGSPSELPNPLGIDLRPIAKLLAGGGVVWVRPGLIIPEVTALLPGGRADGIDELLRSLTGSEPEPAELDGRPARRLQAGPLTITYAQIDGRLVVTTAATLGGTGRLVDDPRFQAAREAAGMPKQTNGFLYADVGRVASLLGLLGGLDAAPHELSRNLEQVESVTAFAAGDGSEQELGVFVAISR